MRVHWLQHANWEDLGSFGRWLATQGHTVRGTQLFRGESLPGGNDFDALIVMGGPMNIHEEARYPWLAPEKALIRDAIDRGHRVLGICLGAQLIADRLGAPVTRNREPEVGWFPVRLSTAGRRARLFIGWPDSFTAFHWHGDTFALPPGAECLASSETCVQQAFSFDGGRVLGLQFHPEVTPDRLHEWFRHESPQPAPYVQSAAEILARTEEFDKSRELGETLLGQFFG